MAARGPTAPFRTHEGIARDRAPDRSNHSALALGLAAAVVAALTGLTDHHETSGHERRVATAHGLTMVAAHGTVRCSRSNRAVSSKGLPRLISRRLTSGSGMGALS